MTVKPPFGAKAPLSPIGGKSPYYCVFFLPPLGEGGLAETERGPFIIQIKIFIQRINKLSCKLPDDFQKIADRVYFVFTAHDRRFSRRCHTGHREGARNIRPAA